MAYKKKSANRTKYKKKKKEVHNKIVDYTVNNWIYYKYILRYHT